MLEDAEKNRRIHFKLKKVFWEFIEILALPIFQ